MDDEPNLNGTLSEKLRRSSFPKARLAQPPPTRSPESKGLSTEHKEQGRVKFHVYKEYVKAASMIGFGIFLLAVLGQQLTSMLANLTLRNWGEHNRKSGSNTDVMRYLIVYGAFSLFSTLFGGSAAVTLWVFCILRSARRLHDSVGKYSFLYVPVFIGTHRCWTLSCGPPLVSLS